MTKLLSSYLAHDFWGRSAALLPELASAHRQLARAYSEALDAQPQQAQAALDAAQVAVLGLGSMSGLNAAAHAELVESAQALGTRLSTRFYAATPARVYFDAQQARDAHGRWAVLTGAGPLSQAEKAGKALAALHGQKAGAAGNAVDKARHAATALSGTIQAGLNARAAGKSGAPSSAEIGEHLGNLEKLTTALRIQAYHAKKKGAADAPEREAAFAHYAGIHKALKAAHKSGGGLHVAHHFGEALSGAATTSTTPSATSNTTPNTPNTAPNTPNTAPADPRAHHDQLAGKFNDLAEAMPMNLSRDNMLALSAGHGALANFHRDLSAGEHKDAEGALDRATVRLSRLKREHSGVSDEHLDTLQTGVTAAKAALKSARAAQPAAPAPTPIGSAPGAASEYRAIAAATRQAAGQSRLTRDAQVFVNHVAGTHDLIAQAHEALDEGDRPRAQARLDEAKRNHLISGRHAQQITPSYHGMGFEDEFAAHTSRAGEGIRSVQARLDPGSLAPVTAAPPAVFKAPAPTRTFPAGVMNRLSQKHAADRQKAAQLGSADLADAHGQIALAAQLAEAPGHANDSTIRGYISAARDKLATGQHTVPARLAEQFQAAVKDHDDLAQHYGLPASGATPGGDPLRSNTGASHFTMAQDLQAQGGGVLPQLLSQAHTQLGEAHASLENGDHAKAATLADTAERTVAGIPQKGLTIRQREAHQKATRGIAAVRAALPAAPTGDAGNAQGGDYSLKSSEASHAETADKLRAARATGQYSAAQYAALGTLATAHDSLAEGHRLVGEGRDPGSEAAYAGRLTSHASANIPQEHAKALEAARKGIMALQPAPVVAPPPSNQRAVRIQTDQHDVQLEALQGEAVNNRGPNDGYRAAAAALAALKEGHAAARSGNMALAQVKLDQATQHRGQHRAVRGQSALGKALRFVDKSSARLVDKLPIANPALAAVIASGQRAGTVTNPTPAWPPPAPAAPALSHSAAANAHFAKAAEAMQEAARSPAGGHARGLERLSDAHRALGGVYQQLQAGDATSASARATSAQGLHNASARAGHVGLSAAQVADLQSGLQAAHAAVAAARPAAAAPKPAAAAPAAPTGDVQIEGSVPRPIMHGGDFYSGSSGDLNLNHQRQASVLRQFADAQRDPRAKAAYSGLAAAHTALAKFHEAIGNRDHAGARRHYRQASEALDNVDSRHLGDQRQHPNAEKLGRLSEIGLERAEESLPEY